MVIDAGNIDGSFNLSVSNCGWFLSDQKLIFVSFKTVVGIVQTGS